jgi:membrane-bound lytic murein transglycosylase D
MDSPPDGEYTPALNADDRYGRPLVPRFLFVHLIMIPSIVLAACPATAQTGVDELLSALRLQPPVLLCGEEVPVDLPQVVERFEKEMLLSLNNRAQVVLWLKRSSRFFPFIGKALGENGLPDDLKYLAIAESALRQHAGSPKGALGVWQLMPQTARKYGLLVNDDVDERRNIYLSTPAALRYLKDLFSQFGSWSLSLAAYNMGEEGLEAEILEQGITDYYRLYLPLETQRFIFRILAIKLIVEAPGSYGFNLSPYDRYEPQRFSTVQIDAFHDLPLRLVATAAGTDFSTIKNLNPELRGHYLAAGSRIVNIPGENDPGFQERLAALVEADTRIRGQRVYVVKSGDSLSGIAERFNVPMAALLIWNRIGADKVIHPGQRLVIFSPPEKQRSGIGNGDGDG